MINTKCPECSAKFYVAENLVVGKVVRFRCRKCGGTITVDGTKNQAESGNAAEDGADSALLSRVPPAPSESSSVQIQGAPIPVAPKDIKPEKGTLRPSPTASPVPGGTLQQLAAAAHATPPAELSASAEPTRQVDRAASFDAGEPTAIAAGASGKAAAGPERKPAPTPKPAAVKPAPTPKPAAVKPAPQPGRVKTALGGLTKPVAEAAPKAGATQEEEGPASSRARLSRISMELQSSVFSVPEDEGVDVPVDMDGTPAYEELEPEPASLRGMMPIAPKPAAPKPAAPKPAPPKPGAAFKPPPPKIGPSDGASPKPGTVKIELPTPKGERPLGPVPRVPAKPVDDDRVDFGAVGRMSAEPLSLPSRDILAPVVAPTDEAPAVEPPPVSERKFAPAAALAPLPPVLAEPKEAAEQRPSRTGLYAGIAAVAAIAIIGGGVLLFRSSGPSVPAPAATATSERDEAPTTAPPATQTATAPGTGAPTDTAAAPATAAATAAETAAKPAETKPAETADREPKRVEPTSTGTSTGTPAPTAPATTPAATDTKPPATAETPPKPAETKPAETAPPPAPPSPGESDAPFDKGAAAAAMGGAKAAAASCKQEGGPQGNANVRVTFAPNGRATVAMVDGPPFAGTPVGGCIASKFRGLRVPPFGGSPVTVRTTVPIF